MHLLNNQYLFKAERSASGFYFVTPRGWEDLSTAIREYERLKIIEENSYDVEGQWEKISGEINEII